MNRDRLKKIAYKVTQPLGFRTMRNYSGEKFIFPFYHLVAENTPDYIKNLYKAPTPQDFKSDLEFLLKYYQPATVEELKQFVLDGKKTNKLKFFLSFDDGLKECYEIVYPILKEKGIPAAFFINPDFVDNKSFFYRFKTSLVIEKIITNSDGKLLQRSKDLLGISNGTNNKLIQKVDDLTFSGLGILDKLAQQLDVNTEEILQKQKPYMTLDQLKQMESDGFIIGSHSMNHPLFANLSEKEQISQVDQSMRFIRENFNPEILTFAFPFTDDGVSSSLFDYIEQNENIDISFGTAGIKRDSRTKHIQRIPMEADGLDAAGILWQEYAWFMLKSAFGKNKINR